MDLPNLDLLFVFLTFYLRFTLAYLTRILPDYLKTYLYTLFISLPVKSSSKEITYLSSTSIINQFRINYLVLFISFFIYICYSVLFIIPYNNIILLYVVVIPYCK